MGEHATGDRALVGGIVVDCLCTVYTCCLQGLLFWLYGGNWISKSVLHTIGVLENIGSYLIELNRATQPLSVVLT